VGKGLSNFALHLIVHNHPIIRRHIRKLFTAMLNKPDEFIVKSNTNSSLNNLQINSSLNKTQINASLNKLQTVLWLNILQKNSSLNKIEIRH
jgi:hypothetical protein